MTTQQIIAYLSAALGLAGVVAIGLFVGTTTNGIPNSITVEGQTINFTYTDDNTGEDLIIYTDQGTYQDGLSHAEVFVAVVNASNKNQDVELAAYFREGDERKRVGNVSVLAEVTQEFFDPVFTEQCQQLASGTDCVQVQTGTSTRQETKNVWVPLDLVQRTAQEITEEGTALSGVTRKTVAGFAAGTKSMAFPVARNRVIYYRVLVEFPPNQVDEFMFEAIGSQGGYGFLR